MENLNRQLGVNVCSKSIGSQPTQQMEPNAVLGLTGKRRKEVEVPSWHRSGFEWENVEGACVSRVSMGITKTDDMVIWRGMAPAGSYVWSSWFPGWWNHLGKIRWRGLAGECALPGAKFEVLKETPAVLSPLFLPRGYAPGWELSAVPPQMLILWNRQPN